MEDRFRVCAVYNDTAEVIEDAQATYDNGNNSPSGSFDHSNYQELLEDKRITPLMCTGYKDKNGVLIYEGDTVCGKGQYFSYLGTVCFGPYEETHLGFYIHWDSDVRQDFLYWVGPTSVKTLEVINNK